MKSTQQSDRETYRAIVLGQGGIELLVAPAANNFLLPAVEIPKRQRPVENLTVAMRKEWDREVICLFNPDVTDLANPGRRLNYQVMESASVKKEQAKTRWVALSPLSKDVFADPADYMAVQQSVTECDQYSSGVKQGWFAKLGWFTELQVWVEEVVRPLQLHLTGRFSQLNASPLFSLVRFETNESAVWFKAVGAPNLREFPITLLLENCFPQYVPPILATRPTWNGWLASEIKGTNLRESQETQLWETTASALAKLQIESISRSRALIDAGARDLKASVLRSLVHPFLDVMGGLMEQQAGDSSPVLSRNELRLLGEQIQEALSLWGGSGVPDTLGHLDLNPENIIVCKGRCVFLDWAEAYVGHPFLSFQYLLEHFRRMSGSEVTADARLTSAYSGAWQSLTSPEDIIDALSSAPMLAVFAYAVASDTWSDPARLDPTSAGYLRSLTRRMNREAKRATALRLVQTG
jgi:hypothetical protein